MARPCPFYILDEVEAALDDINIDRFLRLVRRFAERSQFIVVTHQKRTMDAADILYGVSMGGDGITKVVSRKLPRDELETLPGGPEARRGSRSRVAPVCLAAGDGERPWVQSAAMATSWQEAFDLGDREVPPVTDQEERPASFVVCARG